MPYAVANEVACADRSSLAYTLEGLPRIHRKVVKSIEKEPISSRRRYYTVVIDYLAISFKYLSRF